MFVLKCSTSADLCSVMKISFARVFLGQTSRDVVEIEFNHLFYRFYSVRCMWHPVRY